MRCSGRALTIGDKSPLLMSTVIESLEKRVLKQRPRFDAGDRVRVHFQVVEGSRRRTQLFEGIVLKRQGSGARETFTVRKQSFGVGVERTFPLHSPKIEKLEVAARGDVRRAKLYYLRDKVGKRARVAERRWGIEDEIVVAPEDSEAVDAEGVAVSEAEAELVEQPEEETEAAEGGEAGQGEGAETQAEEQPAADVAGDEAEAEQKPEPDATADASPDKAED
jgi:large subunit ribosomal protein L19